MDQFIVVKRNDQVCTITGPFQEAEQAKNWVLKLDKKAKFKGNRAELSNYNGKGAATAILTNAHNADVRKFAKNLIHGN